MEKLEKYLDQVCRTIGGPLEMREHVRQELREHLLDAIAQHQASGLSEDEAIRRALEEFGKPEEVRSDLEAAHGQRTMWLIDKAMQWKEKTMRAKWLWITWAYLGLMAVIALESFFITFNVTMIVPKFQKLLHDGLIDQAIIDDSETRWMVNLLFEFQYVFGHFTTFIILGAAACAIVFEWFVRSENKPFMRLSALGTIATALMIVVILMSGSMVVLFCLGMPAMHRMARPWAVEQVTSLDASINALEKAKAAKDWPVMQKHAEEAHNGTTRLLAGPAVTSLAARDKVEELRGHVRGIQSRLKEAKEAIREHDDVRLGKAIEDLRKNLEVVRDAAKKQGAE